VARVGGDEFAILLPPPSDLIAALAAAQKVRSALVTPFIVDGILDESIAVHRTPTEGPYVSFAGWKVRVTIQDTSPTTYIVRLV